MLLPLETFCPTRQLGSVTCHLFFDFRERLVGPKAVPALFLRVMLSEPHLSAAGAFRSLRGAWGGPDSQ